MMRFLLLLPAAGLAVGCATKGEEFLQDRDTQAITAQYRQLLANIAEFRTYPDTLPRHVFLRRGTLESEATAGIGVEEFPLAIEEARSVRWEVAPLNDPDDIARVRLLYQWAIGKLNHDALRAKWEALEAGTGRSKVALPIRPDATADWYTDERGKAVAGIHGTFGGKKIWIRDVNGAAEFALAVLRAAPNSRRSSGSRPEGE